MDYIVIDCMPITGPDSMHEALKVALNFPEWYGKNLDALFDCLTDVDQPTKLVLAHFEGLGEWISGFKAVFHDACMENPLLTIETD